MHKLQDWSGGWIISPGGSGRTRLIFTVSFGPAEFKQNLHCDGNKPHDLTLINKIGAASNVWVTGDSEIEKSE